MHKVIFMDIDEPLLPGRAWFTKENAHLRYRYGERWWQDEMSRWNLMKTVNFDPVSVEWFNILQSYSGASFVAATNWCRWCDQDLLMEVFEKNGLNMEFHDDWCTPRRFTSSRPSEIGMWMDDHPGYSGIIIDDDSDLLSMKDQINEGSSGHWYNDLFLVDVDYNNGMSLKNFNNGMKWLGIDYEQVYEDIFNIKKLSGEEKVQLQKDLELLAKCAI